MNVSITSAIFISMSLCMNVKQGSTRRGCGFEYVCAHALDSTWPRPGTLTLDLLIFSYNYITLLLYARACDFAACRSHQL